MGKFSHTWAMMGASWDVLKQDKEILIFPLISAICCLLVLASFAIPIFASNGWEFPDEEITEEAALGNSLQYYAGLFLFYLCTYFIMIFFNSAVIACAVIRMQGEDPTVRDGFRAAFARIGLIFGWALLSATVGLVLRMIEDKSKLVGKIVAGLLGLAWSITSFLVVPILVVEKKGPFSAVKESALLLKKTWGEQVIGNFSFGIVFLVLNIPAIILFVMGFLIGTAPAMIVCIGLAVLYIIVMSLIQTALQAVFQAAVYLYARDEEAPEGFETGILQDAIIQK